MSLNLGLNVDLSQLGALAAKGRSALGRAFKDMALDLWGNVREEAPVEHGRLAGSFELDQVSDLDFRIRSAVAYAAAVNEGTRPRDIVPVNAKALKFVIGDQVIFAKRVHHPGTPANPYIDRAIDRTSRRLDDFVARAVSASMG